MSAFYLHTCSYGEWKPEMGAAVKTSLGSPRFQLAKIPMIGNVWEITPRKEYLKAPADIFRAEYFRQLDRYGVKQMLMRFRALAEKGDEKLVLLCFERLNKGDWCHRQLFAGWWLEQTGEVIPELGAPPPQYEQGALL